MKMILTGNAVLNERRNHRLRLVREGVGHIGISPPVDGRRFREIILAHRHLLSVARNRNRQLTRYRKNPFWLLNRKIARFSALEDAIDI
jgi:hypothetical protein